MIIKNANVFIENGFKNVDVLFDEKIKEISSSISAVTDVVDGEGLYLVPGFIDIHTHGCMGHDTCDRNVEGYTEMTKFYASKGVTSFLFTTMTLPKEELSQILSTAASYIKNGEGVGAYAQGIYLEGPFISPLKKGAQSAENIITPDIKVLEKFHEDANGLIKVVALAPETAIDRTFISCACKMCSVSIAHSNANYETAKEAIDEGATMATHLFNAMPPFSHREPGVIGAALENDSVYTEIICDGIHLHESTIRVVFKAKGDDKVIMVSDSMSAAGLGEGEYMLGGQKVYVKAGKATLADGTIAGSTTNLHDCLKNVVKFGIPLESAIKALTCNPAKAVGVFDCAGSIDVGKNADLVLLDKELNIKGVFVCGKKVV